MLVYLAGAMEHAPDRGKKWREIITPFLVKELKHRIFNPCLEEKRVLTREEHRNLLDWKTSDLVRFRKSARKFIDLDLHTLINKVDYIICLWDQYVLKGGGTHGEITVAYYHKIPVYLVSPMPPKEISSWILGCTTELFEDFGQLKNFLGKKFS